MQKNELAKNILYKNALEYSKAIINKLAENRDVLPTILDALEMTEGDFWDYLNSENISNIVFYDQVLSLLYTNKIKWMEKNNGKSLWFS